MFYLRRLEGLIDSAIFLSQQHNGGGRGGGGRGGGGGGGGGTVATLLLDKSVVRLLTEPGDRPEMAAVVQRALENGIDVDTALDFHAAWQARSQAGQPGSPTRVGRR